MKHPILRDLFAEWTRLKGNGRAPERAMLSPAAIPGVLPDAVVLAFDPAAGHPVRVAGSRVCALFGRELRGHGLVALFEPAERAAAAALVEGIADAQLPALAALVGRSASHGELDLQLLLLPLRVDGETHERLLGGLVGTALPWWLARDPVRSLRIRSLRNLQDPRSLQSPREMQDPHDLRHPREAGAAPARSLANFMNAPQRKLTRC
ncbi:PAS domain-containing protein [Blastochloris tepida]|jgi:hypothetical protein|uniref:PAS domain-containing protein n=1 Tax=Blastochloris tepida TaxID=2233851 RepID=A0A348G0Q0_9HYPH|nr:PAS domain-containing protein [Blastochloris tepida]BBF93133.1 PAS domain-containing protein [Blastochloris tepida]